MLELLYKIWSKDFVKGEKVKRSPGREICRSLSPPHSPHHLAQQPHQPHHLCTTTSPPYTTTKLFANTNGFSVAQILSNASQLCEKSLQNLLQNELRDHLRKLPALRGNKFEYFLRLSTCATVKQDDPS